MFTIKFQCSCHAKKKKKKMRTDSKIQHLIIYPFRVTLGSILLFIERIVLSTRFTGVASNILFTGVENDSNTSRVIASSKTFWFPLDNLEDIFNWVEIQTMCWYGKLSCPNLVPNSSRFYTIFLWVIILQEQLPPWVGRFFKHASKVFTNKRWELLCINSTMVLFSSN